MISTGLGSAVVEHPPYGTGGPGFDSRGRVISKTLKNGSNGFPPWCSGIRVSITTDSSVSVKDDRPGISPWCAQEATRRSENRGGIVMALSYYKSQHHEKHAVIATAKIEK